VTLKKKALAKKEVSFLLLVRPKTPINIRTLKNEISCLANAI